MVQVWYPTQEKGPGKPYRAGNEVSWSKQHLALVATHAVEGASLASDQDRFPLLIFEPSWTGRRNQNTVQAEELASHGYLVVGIEHPYSADLTVFPDGRKTNSTLGEFLDCSSDASVAACVQAAREQLTVRSADARFVLDEFERLGRADPFAGRIDFSRVGIFGHSFGGAVAAEVCRADPRFKAGVNFDGLVFGDVLDQGIGKPFLFLMDGSPVPSEAELEHNKSPFVRELILVAENYDCLRHHPDARGYWASIKGASHMNFCDSPLYSPIRRLTRGGPIKPSRGFQIINAYTVAFFDSYLKGAPDHLFDGSISPYPEVEIDNLYVGDRFTYSRKPRNQLAKEHP
jgi:dienelactone hydrolase